MNLFDLIVTRTARDPREVTVTTWESDEQHYVVPEFERLQVSFNSATGVFMVNAHQPDTDTYGIGVRLVGARLVRADENGIVYAGFTDTPTDTGVPRRLACEVYLSRDDFWNGRPSRVEYAATDATTVELGQHETFNGPSYPTAGEAQATFVGDGDDVLIRRVTSGWRVIAE